METSLAGKVALVAGATRGAGRGIAVQLGAAGATVYVTGRTTRSERSEMNRPETIEETAVLVDEAGGRGIAVRVDHLVPDEVRALVARIKDEQAIADRKGLAASGQARSAVRRSGCAGEQGRGVTIPSMTMERGAGPAELAGHRLDEDGEGGDGWSLPCKAGKAHAGQDDPTVEEWQTYDRSV